MQHDAPRTVVVKLAFFGDEVVEGTSSINPGACKGRMSSSTSSATIAEFPGAGSPIVSPIPTYGSGAPSVMGSAVMPSPSPDASPAGALSLTSYCPSSHAAVNSAASTVASTMGEPDIAGIPNRAPSEKPAGTGPLYKCAICGEHVYESQLDYHVFVCPEPSTRQEALQPGEIGAPAGDAGDLAGSEDKASPRSAALGAALAGEKTAGAGGSAMSATAESQQLSGGSCAAPSALPENAGAQLPSEAAAAAPAPAEHLPSAEGGGAEGGRSAPCPRRAPAAPGGAWKDSSHARHEAAHSARVSMRRNKLSEELRQKEEEECTFKPRVFLGASGRRCAPSAEQNQTSRNQKLKQAEAQAYAEVTLRPKITAFAQAWSMKQHEDGREPVSVFERLYEAAQECTARRSQAASQSYDMDSKDCSTSMSLAPGSIRLSLPRSVPTSELLYSDALDRRERLRAMTEQLQMKEEETAREKLQVLGRSRRYYWQMLERQIKAAFDAAAGADGAEGALMTELQLEDFLVRFGCARPRRQGCEEAAPCDAECGLGAASGDAVAAAAVGVTADENFKVRAALWRHLDAEGTGKADLFTVTVFFHVLMGAVDEVARASKGASASSNTAAAPILAGTGVALTTGVADGAAVLAEPLPAASPTSRATAAQDPLADSPTNGAAASLAAIAEEEVADCRQGALQASGGAGTVPEVCEVDRRIVELLQRFDPVRLRTEFRTLCMQRMYYQHQQQEKQPAEIRESQSVVAPEINEQSRALAAKVVERQKGAAGAERAIHNHVDLLLWRHTQVEAKKEERRALAKSEEVSACTFRPRTSPRPRDLQADLATPRGSGRHQVLYAQGVAKRECQEARAEEDKRERSRAEVKGCTFRPDTARSGKSFHRHDGAGSGNLTPVPRGFYETRERLRAAGECHRLQREIQEDRLARLAPCEPLLSAGGRGSAAPGQRVAPQSTRCGSACRPSPSSGGGPREPLQNLGAPGRGRAQRGHASGRNASASPARSPTRGRGQAASTASRGRPRSQPPHSSRGAGNPRPAIPDSAMVLPVERGATSDSAELLRGLPEARYADPQGAAEGAGAGPPRCQGMDGDVGAADDLPPPLLFVDVNIAPGQPMERLVLREGQSAKEVATEFAARHLLTPVMAQRLHALLEDLLQRQEQHMQQQSLPSR